MTAGWGTRPTSTRSFSRSLSPAMATPARRPGGAGTAISHEGASARTGLAGRTFAILRAISKQWHRHGIPLLALLDGMQQRDAQPRASVPVPRPEWAQRALADVRGIFPGHGPDVGDEQLPARAQHPHGLVHRAVASLGRRDVVDRQRARGD